MDRLKQRRRADRSSTLPLVRENRSRDSKDKVIKSRRRSDQEWLLRVLTVGVLTIVVLYASLPYSRRLLSRSSAHNTSIVFDYPTGHPVRSVEAYLSSLAFLKQHPVHRPDYNELLIDHRYFDRRLDTHVDHARYQLEREDELEGIDESYISSVYLDDFDYAETHHECRRNNWAHKLSFPNCNSFHEQTLDRPLNGVDQTYQVSYTGHGAYRDSFVFARDHDPSIPLNVDEHFVWKSLRYTDDLYFAYDNMYQMHNEAIIMERLTKSPRIVDIFGHCGGSIFAEHMNQEVSDDMVPGSVADPDGAGAMLQEDLDKLQATDVHPMNSMTNDEKLDLSIVMAESIADIHGFEGGVIVHGDIHPVQWLKNAKGQVKLNDFSTFLLVSCDRMTRLDDSPAAPFCADNAEILTFNTETNDYCKIYRCYGGYYRAPEEFRCIDCHEAMDTYAMGNNIYSMLVGLFPFYQHIPNERHSFIQKLLINNSEKPYVDPRYRTRSKIEAGLITIMEQCWEWDLDKRISIFEVVRQLYALRDQVRGGKAQNGEKRG